jgi:very-short-patch-repair endonuclease
MWGAPITGAPKGRVKASYRTRSAKATSIARHLREQSTEIEKRLWRLLRDRRFDEFKFRRQYQCGPYFLDFYCPTAHLAVELDGSGHGYPGQQMRDRARDEFLTTQGIKVLRFWNNQLLDSLENIRTTIWYELMKRTGRTEEIASYLQVPKS